MAATASCLEVCIATTATISSSCWEPFDVCLIAVRNVARLRRSLRVQPADHARDQTLLVAKGPSPIPKKTRRPVCWRRLLTFGSVFCTNGFEILLLLGGRLFMTMLLVARLEPSFPLPPGTG